MRRAIVVGAVFVTLVAGLAVAMSEDSEALIELDKQWGAAAQGQEAVDAIDRIVAADVVAISPDGLGTKEDMIAQAQGADAPIGPYMADNYDVRFLSDDVAVMVHHAGEPAEHWSLHVWQKKDGAWQVVASATAPSGGEDDD
jgi:Domain of unknown function (DUF4440)